MTSSARVVARLHRVDGLRGSTRPGRAPRGVVLALALAASAPLACQPTPPPPATVAVRARTETGVNIANADVFAGATLIARTDKDGIARLDIRGAEGETFLVRVDCPPGYRSPDAPLSLQKPAASPDKTVPEFPVVCHALRHTMVIGVRADNGPDLPVLYLGKEVARTDRSGAAHLSVAMEAHEKIELILGTSGKDADKLRPQNPVAVFEMPDHDDVQVFPVTFTRDTKKVPPVRGVRGR